MTSLLGRTKLLRELRRVTKGGRVVALMGPMGVGKSALLAEFVRDRQERGTLCGLSRQTRGLAAVAAALARMYPDVDRADQTSRVGRLHLVDASEQDPGLLVLDHMTRPGTTTKSLLRQLRAAGQSALFAVDTDNELGPSQIRSWHLADVEVVVPPLAACTMGRLFDVVAAASDVRDRRICPEDRKALIREAQGLPGRLALSLELLSDDRFWADGRVLASVVAMAVSQKVLAKALHRAML